MSEAFNNLTQPETRRIKELLDALRTETDIVINKASWLIDTVFAEEFQSRLLAQHIFMGNPLFQESFDAAFIASATMAGKRVVKAPGGQRFWDVEVEGKRISLKSSKAKSLKDNVLHISKLTEAAWIQDCRTARKRRDKTRELFDLFTNTVDSIFQFRYFHQSQTYELVELPVPLFKIILDLPENAFSADGPTINIPIGQIPPDFTLKLDRSDAKVTIANIRKDLCTVHGSWRIEKG